MAEYFIGLISGTSMDGIDAALVRFGDAEVEIAATHSHPYPAPLRDELFAVRQDASLRKLTDVDSLHRRVGAVFAEAAIALLELSGVEHAAVAAIGSHGQTLRHEPNAEPPYTLQAGDGAVIAASTGLTTVADFRRADIELGGQGAPLTPAFHEWLFRKPGTTRVVLNIGGIANVTILPGDGSPTTGFDTGPGNTLLDAWIGRHRELPFDEQGRWAAEGVVDDGLLERLLADPYFAAPPPKSTGFEYFNLDWLARAGADAPAPVDVQATLSELSARTIAAAVRDVADEVLVCGGGIHNWDLERRLSDALPGIPLSSTGTAGLDPDWVEAVAFAWLAMRTLRGLPGNLPSVTGARQAAVLGETFGP